MIEKTPDSTVLGQVQDSAETINTSAIPGKRVIQEIIEDLGREIESRRFQKLDIEYLSEMRSDLKIVLGGINSDALLSIGQQNLVRGIINDQLENAVGNENLESSITNYQGITDLVILINSFRG